MSKIIVSFCVGFLIGYLFTAFIAGKDWDEKVNDKEFIWRNITYQIVEIENQNF